MRGLSVEARGVKRTKDALIAVGGRGADARPAWASVMDLLTEDAERRFATNGFGQWPDLAPSTVRRKARAGQDSRAMIASGRLHRALTAPRARGGVRRQSKTQARYGTSLFYAQFHHSAKPDRRRELVPTDDARLNRAIAELIERHVVFGERGGTASVL